MDFFVYCGRQINCFINKLKTTAMKKVLFFISALCLFACSEDANIDLTAPMMNESHEVSNGHEIDAAKALEYANIYFNQTETRSSAPLKMDYIVDKTLTRSGDIADDTVAYIINRGVNEGFVIISSDDRVFPILAYSDNGTFIHEEGSIVDVQFTSLIDDYIAENKNSSSKILDEEYYSSCYYMEAVVDPYAQWNQRDPFNYFVIEEHPGCPVGCVPLATGIIMLHCKSKFTYKNTSFNAKKIIRSIEKATNPNYRPPMSGPEGTPQADTATYTYNVATDSVGLILHWIGKDLNTQYTTTGSSTNPTLAISFLKNLGYSIKYEDPLVSYYKGDALLDMREGYILYMDGRKNGSNTKGHTWVADGYDVCVGNILKEPIEAIHCNWGWGGLNDGYYSNDIFKVVLNGDSITYNNVKYNAIKLEYW